MAKILVVEDNALNIKLFCDLLAAHGHIAEAVTDSREAMATAGQFAPDLIITDIQLPYISGVELITLLRADPAFAEVPIMAVTAYSASGDEERIRTAGATAYISKPISVARFIQSVEELLAAPRSPGEAAPVESAGAAGGRADATGKGSSGAGLTGANSTGANSTGDDAAGKDAADPSPDGKPI